MRIQRRLRRRVLRVRRYFHVLFSLDAAYREAKRERDTVMMRELGWQIGYRRMQEMRREVRCGIAMNDPMKHCEDDALEGYSAGTLLEPELELVEEHLLICGSCRKRLTATDGYVRAMRLAASRLRSR